MSKIQNTSELENRVSVKKPRLVGKEQGKFVELPGAEMGKVVVRFPPEASGYLHIGHAKAALLNQHYQLAFNGRLVMRFDDTNPAKEKEDFEKVILEDVDMLKIKPDNFTYTSDYFDAMLLMCESLLKAGHAFIDDTDGEKMRLEREQRIESINRNNSIEKNLELWNQMKLGSVVGQMCCVRAKIDMTSVNGCMRDPTIYRCKPELHPRTADKYKVYPTYDFACPIVDSLEGITHCLRTTEYTDRDQQYYWFCDALKLGQRDNETRPYVWSYSRLNMTNTVLSKRKLTWFVEQGLVDGWDDPRMPTVRGVFRRGMQLEALKQFIISQGSSRTVTAMQWDKIWSLNRSIIDPVAPRHTALLRANSTNENVIFSHHPVEVLLENVEKPYKLNNVPKHPKNPQLGLKDCVWGAPKILIDYNDAELLEVGKRATLINWGNILINRIERNPDSNKIEKVYALTDLENTDFKSTVKITWLPNISSVDSNDILPSLIPVVCVYFEHLINKPVLAKDDDFKQFITKDSRCELQMWGDFELKDIKKSEVIQLQRRGFFICDSPYQPYSLHTGKDTPLVLFHIPDGHSKSGMPIASVTNVNTISTTNTIKEIKSNDKIQSIDKVISKINDQENMIQTMKAAIDEAVNNLLALKGEYKQIAGVEFPQGGIPTPKSSEQSTSKPNSQSVDAIITKINEQGNIVRTMKSNGASKAEIGEAVKTLLALKGEYKQIAGVEFPQGGIPTPKSSEQSTSKPNSQSVDAIITKINEQGNIVRTMKSNGASKAEIGEAVKTLLALKGEYKQIAGVEFPQGGIPTPKSSEQSTSKPNSQSVDEIITKINEQGNIVRTMKSNGASKAEIGEAVKTLLALKGEYKQITGVEFPQGGIPTPKSSEQSTSKPNSQSVDAIITKINEQGNIVRTMKSNGASKAEIGEAVKTLLALKGEYKQIAGVEFPQGGIPTPKSSEQSTSKPNSQSVDEIITKINEQGNIVRTMKSNGASKAEIGEAVKTLLALKGEYKQITGVEFPQGGIPTPKSSEQSTSKPNSQSVDAIITKINEQGNIVRTMKSNGASKAEIGEAVKTLLALKGEYKQIAGVEFPQGGIPTPKSSEQLTSIPNSQSADEIITKINEQGNNVPTMKSNGSSKMKKPKKKENVPINTSKTTDSSQTKKITKLGLEVPKVAENLGDWYSQVLVKSEMIEYYDVSGCYILRPWAYKIWSLIQEWFDARIKSDPLNVENCYFPIFVSRGALEKEKEHIADFAPEVAWVTKSGETDLAEPIAIRPTSETVMYPAFAKWIQSYRDFPLKLNQWNNVVRWEFKHPQPFLRTREFLWQEGHHAYATQEEAERDVLIVLDYYEHVYRNMLAVPVIKGRKTEKEKFAGGDFTATCEAYIAASGRAIQGATSHYLGTNFARMFNVEYEHPVTHEQLFAHQISYGMTTRTIGVMVMVHGDDRGLVLPPNVATIQVVIILCGVGVSTSEDIKQSLTRTCLEVYNRLKGDNSSKENEIKNSNLLCKGSINIRAHADLRDNYSPGWKFNHWELKGVPLRLEIGPKDLDRGQITAVRRDTGEKLSIPLDMHDKNNQNVQDLLVDKIHKLLEQIQQDMLAKAEQEMKNNVIICHKWSDCAINLAKKRLLLVPFCGRPSCEDNIKRDTAKDDGTAEIGASTMGAKSLCVPFEQPDGNEKLKPDDKCIHPECNQRAGFFTLFGRSY